MKQYKQGCLTGENWKNQWLHNEQIIAVKYLKSVLCPPRNIIAGKLLFAEGKRTQIMPCRDVFVETRFEGQKHFWSDPVRMTNGDRFQ